MTLEGSLPVKPKKLFGFVDYFEFKTPVMFICSYEIRKTGFFDGSLQIISLTFMAGLNFCYVLIYMVTFLLCTDIFVCIHAHRQGLL